MACGMSAGLPQYADKRMLEIIYKIKYVNMQFLKLSITNQ